MKRKYYVLTLTNARGKEVFSAKTYEENAANEFLCKYWNSELMPSVTIGSK